MTNETKPQPTALELGQQILDTFNECIREAEAFLMDVRNGVGEYVVKTKVDEDHCMRRRVTPQGEGWDFAGSAHDKNAFIIRNPANIERMRSGSKDERIQVAQPRREAVVNALVKYKEYVEGMTARMEELKNNAA